MDLVSTRDGVLVARHENALSGTTDVADHPQFADRRTTRTIDGEAVTDWFTEDFTLAELHTLRARERLPDLRPANTRFDGLWQVPTLAEIIALVRAKEGETGRTIGLYHEIKHPTYFAGLGFDLAAMLVDQLSEAGYGGEDAPVFIQSFDAEPLRRLDAMTDLRLVQLVAAESTSNHVERVAYADMTTVDGLAQIATYADGIGAELRLLLAPDGYGLPLVSQAHDAGLFVHGWTARPENAFLPEPLKSSGDPAAEGDMATLIGLLQRARVDGVFTDSPRLAVATRACMDGVTPCAP